MGLCHSWEMHIYRNLEQSNYLNVLNFDTQFFNVCKHVDFFSRNFYFRLKFEWSNDYYGDILESYYTECTQINWIVCKTFCWYYKMIRSVDRLQAHHIRYIAKLYRCIFIYLFIYSVSRLYITLMFFSSYTGNAKFKTFEFFFLTFKLNLSTNCEFVLSKHFVFFFTAWIKIHSTKKTREDATIKCYDYCLY